MKSADMFCFWLKYNKTNKETVVKKKKKERKKKRQKFFLFDWNISSLC